MTVLRKNKGRRWYIIYAGSEYGWIGDPWIWEADSRSADYHENMNASMFEKYMKALCQWCKTKYPEKKVVFCMDYAKYTDASIRPILPSKLMQRLRTSQPLTEKPCQSLEGEVIPSTGAEIAALVNL